jgi:hypothetical protein
MKDVVNTHEFEEVDVLIIGAGEYLIIFFKTAMTTSYATGVSGLAAAQTLLKAGFTVRVVEARARFGGRVNPVKCVANLLSTEEASKYPEVTVECGANWVHNLSHENPIYTIAMNEKLSLLESLGDDDLDETALIADRDHYTQTGTPRVFTKEELEDGHSLCNKFRSQMDVTRRSMRKRRAVSRHSTTLADVFSRYVQAEETAGEMTSAKQQLVNFMHEQHAIAEARDLDMLTFCRWYDVPDDAAGGEGLVMGGISQILKPLSTGVDIILSCPVVDIIWKEADCMRPMGHPNCQLCKLSYEDSFDKIILNTAKGAMRAKNCIVTVPCGVLKHGDINFHPPLPGHIQDSIDILQPGLMDIVVFRFDTQFWPSDVFLFGVPPTNETSATRTNRAEFEFSDVSNRRRSRSMSECSSHSSQSASCSDWDYGEKDTDLLPSVDLPPDCLFSSFMNLSKSRDDKCPLLLAQVYGRRARIVESMTPQALADAAVSTLKMIFGDDIPAPIGVTTHPWGRDQYAYGSWNNYRVGVTRQEISEFTFPMACPNRQDKSLCIQFAGEWTHPTKMGLLQGAYETGARCANHIVNSHSSLKSASSSSLNGANTSCGVSNSVESDSDSTRYCPVPSVSCSVCPVKKAGRRGGVKGAGGGGGGGGCGLCTLYEE